MNKPMYGILLLLHLLGATIWTGGHLVLAIAILPRVLREKSPARLLEFESLYERVVMSALAVQMVTGLLLADRWLPDVTRWFTFDNPASHGIAAKLLLLALTAGFALSARLWVIPTLAPTLKVMAFHMVAVTVLGVLFIVVGVSFRTGWLA